MGAFYLHPEMGDDGSGPVIIGILLLYFLAALGLLAGTVYLIYRVVTHFKGRR